MQHSSVHILDVKLLVVLDLLQIQTFVLPFTQTTRENMNLCVYDIIAKFDNY